MILRISSGLSASRKIRWDPVVLRTTVGCRYRCESVRDMALKSLRVKL
jgi:hypothetical protein